MPIRCLAVVAGLFFMLLGLAACDSSPTPVPVPTASPPPILAATASPVPPSATAPSVAASPTAAALPTDTPALPPATSLPPTSTPLVVVLPFEPGLDEARLETLYSQAGQLISATAPGAKLSYVRLDLVPAAAPALVQFDFYAPDGPQFVRAQAANGAALSLEPLKVPDPAPVVFDALPWQRNPRWPLLLSEALAQAKVTPDPAHGGWRFSLEARPGGPDWQLGLEGTFASTLADGQVREQPVRPGQTPGPAVAVPTADTLPLGYSLNNAAIDRYYRAALRLVTPKASDATLRAVDVRLGDPADAGEDTVLYHFYSARQKQAYLATFDIGGRREVTPESLPEGASRTLYKESTLPWKTAPTWPGLAQIAAQVLTDQPVEHTRLLLAAQAGAPATWTATASIVYQFALTGETVTLAAP
jgi:hypothetical protein